eukprot:1355703-Alexandrium_andersonii.AAC.1
MLLGCTGLPRLLPPFGTIVHSVWGIRPARRAPDLSDSGVYRLVVLTVLGLTDRPASRGAGQMCQRTGVILHSSRLLAYT